MSTVPEQIEKLSQVENPGLIHRAMIAVMRDIKAIGKDAKNQQQGFNYRGIDDVYNTLNSVLAEHGVYTTSQILERFREERTTKSGSILAYTVLRMRYYFHAEDGSFVPTEVEGEGMDSGDKSTNKAMSIAHKYALLQAFCVPTKDMDDPDSQAHENVQPRGAKPPQRQQAQQPQDRKPVQPPAANPPKPDVTPVEKPISPVAEDSSKSTLPSSVQSQIKTIVDEKKEGAKKVFSQAFADLIELYGQEEGEKMYRDALIRQGVQSYEKLPKMSNIRAVLVELDALIHRNSAPSGKAA